MERRKHEGQEVWKIVENVNLNKFWHYLKGGYQLCFFAIIALQNWQLGLLGCIVFWIVHDIFTNLGLGVKWNYLGTTAFLDRVFWRVFRTGGSFDVNSSIILEGTFKTISNTLPAIDINHNRLILDKASIITGGGYSVNSSAPINIIVKPGTSSNVTTSASVTQLGSTITVNSNFNN